jgi:hypothetical protein
MIVAACKFLFEGKITKDAEVHTNITLTNLTPETTL